MSKKLEELSAEELGALFPVILTEYNEKWPDVYEAEKNLIISSLDDEDVINVYHIGSTVVPYIKSKPTIDILLEINENTDIEKIKSIFRTLGYEINIRRDKPSLHITFVKGYTESGFKGQSFHVHLRYKDIHKEIIFRDYLISNPETAKEYEKLKLHLAEKYKNNRELYTEGKSFFIVKILNLAK